VQQTSDLHNFFLNLFNRCKTVADLGDVSMWAAGQFTFRNLIDGSLHTATGVAFSKVPDEGVSGEGAEDHLDAALRENHQRVNLWTSAQT
jgi:hypothetical protein